MSQSPLIVVSLEGLTPSALGCYGSSWNATPAIDRLASTGCVWDRLLATSDRPASVLDQWIHAEANWARQLRSQLGPLELITDCDPDGLQESCFDQILSLAAQSPRPDSLPATDIEDTQFGQLIAAALDRDASDRPWGVLWLHSRFLTRCWDAPRDLVMNESDPPDDQWLEDQDDADGEEAGLEGSVPGPHDVGDEEAMALPPSYFSGSQPPQVALTPNSHPDLVTAWMRTYGCQVRLVDWLLDILLQTIEVKNPTVVLVGTSGFRLGQCGFIGHQPESLRSADIRLPLVVNSGGPLHVPQLTGSDELGSLLARLSDPTASVCSPSQWSSSTKATPSISIDSARAIRAVSDANWFYVQDADQSEHLFLKPDDVEDFNDVGRLRQDVIEVLREETKNGPTDL